MIILSIALKMEGLNLDNWTLGKKLGSGGCADVYEAYLKDSSCLDYVIKVSALPRKKSTKADKDQIRIANLLYAENMIYRNFYKQKNFASIPLRAYGEKNGYRYLVMERLGRTLGDVVRDEGPINESTVSRIGLELINAIQYMHTKNIIYVDIKPDNFMVNMKEDQAYCVDFGICDSFMSAVTGKHKKQVIGPISGTPTFLSLNCHLGTNASRRDDIESLLYVLAYMIKGSLPWEKAPSDGDGSSIKASISLEQLCEGMHPIWIDMLNTVRQYKFEDKPDYKWFGDQFKILAGDYDPK